MLSKLLESMLAESGLRPINSTQIRPNEELRIHLFNDDQLNNHRIQITDSEDPFRQPGLPEYEHQNPSAHLGEAGTPDGLYACLSTAQRQTITCVGGTPSAVALFSETDLFDVTINNTSYVNQTFEQLQKLLEVQQVEMVTMTTEPTWSVQYTKISTGEIVQLNTGSIVTRELIDPNVNFEDVESSSYQQYLIEVLDRKDLIINKNVIAVSGEPIFVNWENIENVTLLGGGIIGNGMFSSLQNINNFIIGENVIELGNSALAGTSINKLIINEGLQVIGNATFASISTATELILPDSLTTIGQYACVGWSSGNKLVIGSGIKSLRGDEFQGWNSNGTILTFKEGITHIGTESPYAFQGWKGTSLSLPNSLIFVGEGTFANWNEATTLRIGTGPLVIDKAAFQLWPKATLLDLGGTISIGVDAFLNWTGYINPLTIPGNVKEIYGGAFLNWENCKGLTINEGTITIGAKENNGSSFDGMQSFTNWYNAEFLHLPNSLTSTYGSFVNWFKCNDLHIGTGLTVIGHDGYGGDEFTNLGRDTINFDVIFPDTVTDIISALGGTAVRSVTIGNNVKTLGTLPYKADHFYIRSPIPPTILDNSLLPSAMPSLTVHVPNMSTYIADETWARMYNVQVSQTQLTLFKEWLPV